MRRIRFNIASLLVVVLFLGVCFAALRESNELWDSGLFTLTLGVLLTSILLAIHRTESRQVFWMGFALFGWTYMALSLVPSIESRLITTKALTYLDSKVPGRTQTFFTVRLTGTGPGTPGSQVSSVAFSPDGRQLATSSLGTVRLWDAKTGTLLGGWAGTTENFVRIGHSLLALIAAWVGGLLSRRLRRASRHPEPEAVELS
jgi:WD40 repeat protein